MLRMESILEAKLFKVYPIEFLPDPAIPFLTIKVLEIRNG